MATRIVCDRCERNIPNNSGMYVHIGAVHHDVKTAPDCELCPDCTKELRLFLQPIPRPAEVA